MQWRFPLLHAGIRPSRKTRSRTIRGTETRQDRRKPRQPRQRQIPLYNRRGKNLSHRVGGNTPKLIFPRENIRRRRSIPTRLQESSVIRTELTNTNIFVRFRAFRFTRGSQATRFLPPPKIRRRASLQADSLRLSAVKPLSRRTRTFFTIRFLF